MHVVALQIVNVGSDDGLVSSDNKPLPEAMLTSCENVYAITETDH